MSALTNLFRFIVITIHMVTNLIFHKKTKYVGINYHFIKDQIVRGFVTTKHVSTKMQLVDILTKAFDRKQFSAFLINLKI